VVAPVPRGGAKRGWVIVDMKNDWKAIDPEQH
jgi:hypothetical protein